MSMSLNKAMIIGNVGTVPEMRYTPSGREVAHFSVATNRRWTGTDGEQHEETQWHRIVTWGKLAETCTRLITSKGTKVYVEGRIQTRSWEGQDGQKRYMTEIIADSVFLLDSRQRDQAREGGNYDLEPDDSLPFDDHEVDRGS